RRRSERDARGGDAAERQVGGDLAVTHLDGMLHLAIAADVDELTLARLVEIGRDHRAGQCGLGRLGVVSHQSCTNPSVPPWPSCKATPIAVSSSRIASPRAQSFAARAAVRSPIFASTAATSIFFCFTRRSRRAAR